MVIAWRVKNGLAAALQEAPQRVVGAGACRGGERGEHYKKNSMNKNSATMIVKHP